MTKRQSNFAPWIMMILLAVLLIVAATHQNEMLERVLDQTTAQTATFDRATDLQRETTDVLRRANDVLAVWEVVPFEEPADTPP